MAAFTYDKYTSPYVGQISELLRAPGEAYARAAELGGNAQANAAVQRGQAYAGAAQQVGQAISGIPQQIEQAKSRAIQQQHIAAQTAELDAQAAQRKQQLADLKALDQALSTPGGRDAVLESAPGHLRPQLLKQYQEADTLAANAKKAVDQARKDQQEYLGYLGAQVLQSNYDPATALATLHHAREQYGDDPAMLKQIDAMRQQFIEQPESIKQITDAAVLGSSYKDLLKPKDAKTREIKTIGPDGNEVTQIVEDKPGQSFATPPRVDKETNPTEASLAALAAKGDKDAAKALGILRSQRETPSANEPLVAIMRDGKPVLVPRSAAVNQTPATTREQGRQVTSGDAGKVTELQTSLDDIGRLRSALSESGETGTISKIGASVPNWVTDVTGWGTDAKKKQALIDRVKQVIGKALEGGVLRKEDELKYEKILPTIGDTTAVVKAKLDGLDSAISQRKDRTLESLSDAGYDVSRFIKTPEPAKEIKVGGFTVKVKG